MNLISNKSKKKINQLLYHLYKLLFEIIIRKRIKFFDKITRIFLPSITSDDLWFHILSPSTSIDHAWPQFLSAAWGHIFGSKLEAFNVYFFTKMTSRSYEVTFLSTRGAQGLIEFRILLMLLSLVYRLSIWGKINFSRKLDSQAVARSQI